MIKSFFSLARKGIFQPKITFQPSLFFTQKSFFASTQERDSYTELRYLAKIVGTTYFKHNDEVTGSNDVRLVDTQNKLIGIYSINEAKKKCRDLGTDLLLINPNSKPMICKAMNYKEDLYKRFVKDVFEKDLPKISKELQRKGETSKSIKLGSKMTISDLKNKSIQAQAIAKQVKNVRIYMQVTDETEENGRNVMFTFRDLTKDFLMAKRDIEVAEIEEEEDFLKKDKAETEDKKILSQEFQSFLYTEQKIDVAQKNLKDYTEDEIKQIINTYIQKEIKKSKVDEALYLMRQQNDPELQAVLEESKGESEIYTDDKELVFSEDEDSQELQREYIRNKKLSARIFDDVDHIRGEFAEKNRYESFFDAVEARFEAKENAILKLENLKRNIELQNKRRRK